MKVIYRYKFLGLTVKNEMVLLPDGVTVQMELTQGEYCTFDLMDLKYVINHRWRCDFFGKRKYVATTIKLEFGRRKSLRMHKAILNPEGKLVVDHINGDGLNNTRSNLRICSQKENTMNRGAQINNKLGIKGVYFLSSCSKFNARIQINGKGFHLGLFEDQDHAALAYNIAAKEFFGEFALLNDIPENVYLSKHEIKVLYRQMHKIRNYLNNQNDQLENQN